MRRPLRRWPAEDTGQRWVFDPDRLTAAVEQGARVLLLVNPHNPTGRVLDRAELEAVARVAVDHDLLVVADEIHADLTHEPQRHVPFASLRAEVAARTVTLTSATKAFNLAGIRCAVAHVGSRRLREALDAQPDSLFGEVARLSVAATLAAWAEGDEWLAETLSVLRRNLDHVADALAARLPAVRHRRPEATYLAWLDCRALGLPREPASMVRRHGVQVSPGAAFGEEGRGFLRLNVATSRAVLDEVLDRVTQSLANGSAE